VFIKADREERIRRIVEYYGADPLRAEEQLKKADKQRASYYNYYATGSWGHVDNYDLCVDTGALGITGAVELIACCAKLIDRKAELKDPEAW